MPGTEGVVNLVIIDSPAFATKSICVCPTTGAKRNILIYAGTAPVRFAANPAWTLS